MIKAHITDIIENNKEFQYNFNKLFEIIYSDFLQKNKQELINNTKILDKKIRKIYNKDVKILKPEMTFDEYKQYILNNIKNEDINTMLLFIKSPLKQNICEYIQLRILEKHFNIEIEKTDAKLENAPKTIDGISKDGEKIFQCKYIKESGGNQDHQKNDLLKFNQDLTNYTYKENYLVVSGIYAINKIEKWLNNPKNKLHENTYVIILDDKITIIDNKLERKIYHEEMNLANEQKKYNKYYSTNKNLIYDIGLTDDNILEIVKDTIILEPFAGDCDLINLLREDLTLLSDNEYINQLKLYDITKINKIEEIKGLNIDYYENIDTLLNSPFENREDNKYFVITNPPYTAKNKLSNDLKSKYNKLLDTNVQDLYQIFIKQLISNYPIINGGLIIIPMNFLFGKQSKSLREEFLKYFNIYRLNIFEKRMFEDTSQSTITLLFINKQFKISSKFTKIFLHSTDIKEISLKNFEKIMEFDLTKYLKIHNNYQIKVCRNHKIKENFIVSNIIISLLDPNIKAYINKNNKEIEDINTDRAFMRLCFTKEFSESEEEKICQLFNEHLKIIRDLTYSLIFTSYREYSRKRLTFEEAYHIIKYIVNEEL